MTFLDLLVDQEVVIVGVLQLIELLLSGTLVGTVE
jgi:hypothetical protein